MQKLSIILALAMVSLSWLSVVEPAQAKTSSSYVKVIKLPPGQVLWIRSGPGQSFKRIGFLPYSARHIRNYGCKHFASGDWCSLRYRGARGWAAKGYLAADHGRRT